MSRDRPAEVMDEDFGTVSFQIHSPQRQIRDDFGGVFDTTVQEPDIVNAHEVFTEAMREAHHAAEQGNYPQSLTKFDKAIRFWQSARYPHDRQLSDDEDRQLCLEGAIMFEERAQIFLEIEQEFSGIKSAREAITIVPDFVPAYLTCARCELNWGDARKALETIQHAVALDPGNEEVREQYLEILGAVNALRIHDLNTNGAEKIFRVVRVDEPSQRQLQDLKHIRKRLKKRLKSRDHVGRIPSVVKEQPESKYDDDDFDMLDVD